MKQQTLSGGPVPVSTADTIVSAHVADNAAVFPKVLALHVPRGARVADVTYGRGVFWNEIPPDAYDVVGSDRDPAKAPVAVADCRALPYATDTLDALVLDPPYASGYYRDRDEQPAKSDFPARYGYGAGAAGDGLPQYHAAVRQVYADAGAEAARAVRSGGTVIVKTQDEVVNHTNWFTHCEIMADYRSVGLTPIDLFVVVRHDTPTSVGTHTQVHARKNHSYFLVFANDGPAPEAAVAPDDPDDLVEAGEAGEPWEDD